MFPRLAAEWLNTDIGRWDTFLQVELESFGQYSTLLPRPESPAPITIAVFLVFSASVKGKINKKMRQFTMKIMEYII